jgi:hypothetical protein
MGVLVSREDLLAAFEWVSAGDAAAVDCNAYVSRLTGTVHWVGEGIDEEPPEDIEDGSVYVAVPHKSELDLGRSLALRYVEAQLPQSYETVHEFFRKRGAYSRFKSLLERAGHLEAWHSYEQNAVEEALREWCKENGFALGHVPAATDG